jgi:hypothetical protein
VRVRFFASAGVELIIARIKLLHGTDHCKDQSIAWKKLLHGTDQRGEAMKRRRSPKETAEEKVSKDESI